MNPVAPILLFAFNRPEHVRRTVQALQRNFLAGESLLFVFSDGPRSRSDISSVEEVRNYCRAIRGFRDVIMIERHHNLGLANSIIQGVKQTLTEWGRVIVLEDDMITSPFFLNFMNEALERYETEAKVISIHGYTYPTKKPLPETFFLKGADCWGWATWKRGWDIFEEDGGKLLSRLAEQNLIKRFNMDGAFPYTQMLRDQMAGKNDSWAIRWHASAFLADKLTLHPGKSLVRNIGLDSTGIHCGPSQTFDVTLSERAISIGNIPISENPVAREMIKAFFRSLRPTLADRARRLFTGFPKTRDKTARGQSI